MSIKLKALLSVIIVGLSAVIWGWFTYSNALEKSIVNQQTIVVEIPKGASFNQIIERLQQQHIEIEPFWFKAIAYRYNLAGKLKAGEYELTKGLTTLAALRQFAEGKVKHYALTFPEGWTFKDMLKLLADTPKLDHLLTSKKLPEILKMVGIDKPNAEGWFFPDTYSFTKGTSDIAILKKAYLKMQATLDQEWQQKQPGLPLKDAYQALTLASIIEKETGIASERGQISGVFTRRLQKGMLLQTDPTVIYGMGDAYQGNIRSKDLKAATPYNTYVITGLPPSPIAMPGREAIYAALHPVAGNSLYFVAKGGGGHLFSESLAAHNDAVNKYQRKQKPLAHDQR
ncbi:MAG: endolytic transglycosylase MltG [Methylococcaceae bacterium]|nr:endolytic transglycosylase MltG [Methylococcaceae bacterium]